MPHLQTFTLMARDERTARTVAGLLTARGHLLVTAAPKEQALEPEFAGWWSVDSLAYDPPEVAGDDWWRLRQWEFAAVQALAREHGCLAYGGGGGNDLAFQLTITGRDGLIVERTVAQAREQRAPVLAGFPPPPPPAPQAPPLRYVAEDGGAPEISAITEHIARQQGADYPLDLIEEAEEHEAYDQHDELGAWQEEGGAGDLLGELFDEALHQGSCFPWTASRVPLLADLAVDERLTDRHRSEVLFFLYAIATVGRRHLAAAADKLHLLGSPAVATPDTVAARAAVAAALPRVAARRADSELYAFLGAALAAACPEAAHAWPVAELEALAQRWQGTPRGPAAALILALATADPAATRATLAEFPGGSPYADPRHRAVAVLQQLIETELSRATGAR